MYGNKKMMIQYLKSEKVIQDETAENLLKNPSILEPGLYGVVSQFGLYLVFWHNETAFVEVSRKDPACNFIKFLEQLSDRILAFVAEEEARIF